MENIIEEYTPTDEFLADFARLTYEDFCDNYDLEQNKKSRNQYDNRMRTKNVIIYFMERIIYKLERKVKTKEAACQTYGYEFLQSKKLDK